MSEHVFDYDAWAVEMRDALPEHTWLGVYMAIKDVMHRRKREPIVRCRDCKHYADHEWMMVTDVSDVCHFFGDGVKVEPDGFCKWGEVRQ